MPRMNRRSQPDLFGHEPPQGDLFGEPVPEVYVPKPEHVRNRLNRLLGQARAAERMPWENVIVKLYQSVFDQLSAHLPEEEGRQYVLAFEREIERLRAAG